MCAGWGGCENKQCKMYNGRCEPTLASTCDRACVQKDGSVVKVPFVNYDTKCWSLVPGPLPVPGPAGDSACAYTYINQDVRKLTVECRHADWTAPNCAETCGAKQRRT